MLKKLQKERLKWDKISFIFRQMLWKFKETADGRSLRSLDGQYFMQKISCFTGFVKELFILFLIIKKCEIKKLVSHFLLLVISSKSIR
jgi:hypothetical protein